MTRHKSLKRVLSKAARRARRHGPRSEFIVMCECIAERERRQADAVAHARFEAELRRNRAA